MKRSDAEVQARFTRTELGISLTEPISDLLTVVEEDARVPVGIVALPPGVAGVMRRARGQAFIFVSGIDPPVRQRFTLAHEFGHYRLEHGSAIDGDRYATSTDPREAAANAFAAEFLAPRQAVANWMETRGRHEVDLETVVRLGCHFGLSAQAAFIRMTTVRKKRLANDATIKSAIEAGEHHVLRRRLGLFEKQDSLTAVRRLPRLPQVMQRRLLDIYEAGLLDVDRLATATLQRTEDVCEQVAGVTAPTDE